MTLNAVSKKIHKAVMGFSYYYYFMACFYAGLFCRAFLPPLSMV